MQKPSNKNLKDFLNEKVAKELELDLSIVETVISWSYEKANKATHSNKEIELSGIGTLKLSPAKLRRRIASLEQMLTNIKEQNKQEFVKSAIEELKARTDG